MVSELVIDRTGDRATVGILHDGGKTELPALWLRERSPAVDALDARTGQRLFDPHLLPVDLFVVTAAVEGEVVAGDQKLRVLFSDGHQAVFDPALLLADLALGDGLPSRELWTADIGRLPAHDWNRFDQPAAELAALTDFLRLGAILIDGVPTAPDAVMQVASRFGFVRTTNFGAVFEVRSVPDSIDLAYRSVSLGPHTDNPYRTPPPGIQLLHCLVNDTTGGQSTLVDGLAAVARLAVDEPDAVDLLAAIPVRFRYRDDTTEIVTVRPMLERDHTGVVTGLTYSPRLDETPLMAVAEMQRFQTARQRLARLLTSEAFEIRFTLAAGQLMMFDNNRVLHGRTAFDPDEGLRHLQGCYIDHDGPRARYRVLARQVGVVGQTVA